MTDQSTINPAIVSKIKKLLNLAKDGAASESEQEQAAAHAQRLMLEHNISVATAESHHEQSRVTRRAKENTKGYAYMEWQRKLMSAIATSSFVTVTSQMEWRKGQWRTTGYELVGREENVISASITFDYLRTTVERLAKDFVGWECKRFMSNEAVSFKKGCAERITARVTQRHRDAMNAQREAAQASNTSGTALVPIMADFAEAEKCANEDFRLNLAPGTTARKHYVSSLMTAGFIKVRDLFDTDYKDVTDKLMLRQAADAAVLDIILPAGFNEEEHERFMNYAVVGEIDIHVERIEEKKNPGKKRKQHRSPRSWYSAPTSTLNHSAYSAGWPGTLSAWTGRSTVALPTRPWHRRDDDETRSRRSPK